MAKWGGETAQKATLKVYWLCGVCVMVILVLKKWRPDPAQAVEWESIYLEHPELGHLLHTVLLL